MSSHAAIQESAYKKIRNNQINELQKKIEENFLNANFLQDCAYIFHNHPELYIKISQEIEKYIYDRFKF